MANENDLDLPSKLEAAARAARPAEPELFANLLKALEDRSRQFHKAERERTSTFCASHGSWNYRIYDRWEECPTHPCRADRELIERMKAAGEAPRPVSAPASQLVFHGAQPGYCYDIDGATWHRDGDTCQRCGFGLPGDDHEVEEPRPVSETPATITTEDQDREDR